MSDTALFDALGFRWDRSLVRRPVDILSVSEVLADFDRGMAGHVWAAAVLEGNPFTYPEVQTLLEGVTVGGHKVTDAEQILRLRDGHTLLRDLVASGQFALTKEVSDALHAVIAGGEALESGGTNLRGLHALGLPPWSSAMSRSRRRPRTSSLLPTTSSTSMGTSAPHVP